MRFFIELELIPDYGRHACEGKYNDSVWIKGNAGVLIAQAKHWASFAYCHAENI
jgi:hypothetical protein